MPHTKLEKFEGFSIARGAILVHFGMMDANLLKFYIKITDTVKERVQHYFGLKNLYFTYTHLVCRSAMSDDSSSEAELSHAIHSDNCNLKEDGQCTVGPPSYTWRDYSAILYLNDDFDGGEFIFVSDPKGIKIESAVQPKCGRMVAFSSGKENLHGVNGVRKGSRCAIGIWFTMDKKHIELDREITIGLLNKSH